MSTNIVLGVTGSIAAVKAFGIVRALQHSGFSVRVAMTKSATRVITPASLRSITEVPPYVEMWSPDDDQGGEHHIRWAEWASAILIAPATASCLAQLRHGFYDNTVTLVAANLSPTKWFIAPAMAQAMWDQVAVQQNVTELKSWGVRFLGPVTGTVASGASGQRMMEPRQLAKSLREHLSSA